MRNDQKSMKLQVSSLPRAGLAWLLATGCAALAQQPPPPPPPSPPPSSSSTSSSRPPPMGPSRPPNNNPQSQLNLANPGSPQQMMQRMNSQLQSQRMTPPKPVAGISSSKGLGSGQVSQQKANAPKAEVKGEASRLPRSTNQTPGIGAGAVRLPSRVDGLAQGNFARTPVPSNVQLVRVSPLESLR